MDGGKALQDIEVPTFFNPRSTPVPQPQEHTCTQQACHMCGWGWCLMAAEEVSG